MSQSELKHIIRSALASLEAVQANRDKKLTDLETQLSELLSRQLPGSDPEFLLLLIRECVAEARAGGQGD